MKKKSQASKRSKSQKRVRYAAVGLGHITQVALLPAFAGARRNSELVGVVSGDVRKIASVRRRYGARLSWGYSGYDEMLASGEVDAVYIGLPNDMHHEYALRALRAGVHVLCEKPLAPTAKECRELVHAAHTHRARLMTAYRLHFERANLEVLALLRAGRIGEARIFESVFTMQIQDRENIRLSGARAGGPLYDLGVYCLNAARAVFRAEPERVACFQISTKDPRFHEVEETASCVLRFPGDRLATFTCSFGAGEVSEYRVVGTQGSIRVEPAYEYSEGLAYHVTTKGQTRTRRFAARDQFAPELMAMSDWVLHGRAPSATGEEGLADVRVIEALHRSAARDGVPIALAPASVPRRPRLTQVVDRPAHPKPKPVHARSASGS